MNKKELMNRGLSDEHADIVIEMIKDSFVPLYRFNEINDKMKSYKSQLDDKTAEVDTLTKKVGDTEKLTKEIQDLKDANSKAAGEHAAALSSLKKSNAIDSVLRDSKAKNVKAVKALLDLDKITFENDTLVGLDDQIKTLQESDQSKFMFETDPGYKPKGTEPGEPSGGSANKTMSFGEAIKAALGGNKN